MNLVQIDNWQEYHRDGEQFLSTACAAHRMGKKGFSRETLYNVTCMAIEKLVMAFLMKNGDLAENHTMGDLQRALQRHLGELPELSEKLQYLDGFQEICDLEEFSTVTPSKEDIVRILAIGEEVRDVLTPYLQEPKHPFIN